MRMIVFRHVVTIGDAERGAARNYVRCEGIWGPVDLG